MATPKAISDDSRTASSVVADPRFVVTGRVSQCVIQNFVVIGEEGQPPAAYVAQSGVAVQLIDRFNQHAELLAALKSVMALIDRDMSYLSEDGAAEIHALIAKAEGLNHG